MYLCICMVFVTLRLNIQLFGGVQKSDKCWPSALQACFLAGLPTDLHKDKRIQDNRMCQKRARVGMF